MSKAIDWSAMLVPGMSVMEIVLRGILVYAGVFVLLRLVAKRETGMVNRADLLMMVLIADASQNAMTAEYRSVPEGLLLVGTIIACNYALDWVGHRFPAIRRYLHPPPLPLIEHGRLNRRNMRQELVTLDELETRLRMDGIDDISQVKRANVEGDGRISVITYDRRGSGGSGGDRSEASA